MREFASLNEYFFKVSIVSLTNQSNGRPIIDENTNSPKIEIRCESLLVQHTPKPNDTNNISLVLFSLKHNIVCLPTIIITEGRQLLLPILWHKKHSFILHFYPPFAR